MVGEGVVVKVRDAVGVGRTPNLRSRSVVGESGHAEEQYKVLANCIVGASGQPLLLPGVLSNMLIAIPITSGMSEKAFICTHLTYL